MKNLFPQSPRFDLLLSDLHARLRARPWLLRTELLAGERPRGPVILDEVQKIPALLDEVHWLIENRGLSFVLCGSSARKLKRSGANLLGGRALRYELYPLVYPEIPGFNLARALNHGLLPRHYVAADARKLLGAYVGDYLKEEIAAEGLSRNLPAFSRFLESAAFCNGEIVNELNIASECAVSSQTVHQYFRILEDTLLGRFVPAYRKRPKRRVILSPKFYFLDVGVANFLLKRGPVLPGGESFGKAFEHFLFQEIFAHSRYSGLDYPLSYWRTASQIEVDFILGENEAAVEVKGVECALPRHCRGLSAFMEEYKVKRAILVTLDPRPRVLGDVQVWPWEHFLQKLWSGEVMG